MPTPQTVVEPVQPTERSLGSLNGFSTADSEILSEAFHGSPLVLDTSDNPKMTDVLVKKAFRTQVMRGAVEDSGGYYAFEVPFNRDYLGYGVLTPPAYDFGQGWDYVYSPGDPINSFVPNLKSAPNADPYAQPDPRKNADGSVDLVLSDWANDPGHKASAPFVGEGTLLSPQNASVNILKDGTGWDDKDYKDVEAVTLGDYLLGDSGATGPA
jgi:hypothetical protein